MNEIGATPDAPVYFKFVRDENGVLQWQKIALMLAVTIASGYLASKSQRWGSSSTSAVTDARMKLSEKKIMLGHNLQRIGKKIEEAGWASYEALKPVG